MQLPPAAAAALADAGRINEYVTRYMMDRTAIVAKCHKKSAPSIISP
jgi:hypothetical protein